MAVRSAFGARRGSGGGRTASATAGALDSRDFVTCASSLNSSCGSSRACMSYLDAVLSAPARAPAAALVARSSAPSSSAVGLCMHAHGHLCMMHVPIRGRTWLGRGPTGRRCTKGGVSGPAEDLRPVSEVEAGVNFRPAGWVRGQVAGSLPGRQPGTGTRRNKGSVVTPSLHPEVPDSLSVSPGPGERIRQLMGWTKVCGTAQSGIWVLKGNTRTCMFPANLDPPPGGMEKAGFIQDCLGLRQGTTVCVHTSMDMEQQSDHKLIRPSGMELLVCGAGSRPSYHLGVVRRNCQRG